jgi:aminoglycoside phosphotransferase (APT) family kinase protein
MYEVADEWLFRFPKRADVVPWSLREIAIMPAITAAIGVPVPRFEKIGAPGDAFPYPFAGYRRLPGIDADDAERLDLSAIARALGPALTKLHSLDPALIPPAPEIDEPGGDEFDTRDGATGAVAGSRGSDEAMSVIPEVVRDEAGAYLREEIACPLFPGPARVVHNDLLPEHVLIDPSTGRLAGIIDFADLSIGDPAGDFAGLLSIGGRVFVREVIANYAVPTDDGFPARIRWRTRNLHLSWLVDAIERDDPELAEYRELVMLAFDDGLSSPGA